MSEGHRNSTIRSSGRYVLIGLLTAAPLGVTWFILDFLFGQLSRLGRPLVTGFALALRPQYPQISAWLLNETLQSVMAVIVVVTFLYLLGWATTRVIGQQLIGLFEGIIGRIPFVDTIYRSTKRFLTVASSTPEGERRVVLINFPSAEMKALGLITRTIRDADSGEELAVVYVPTSPNPTSGYIEIVPIRQVTMTDWTFDQAMAFVVTGGTSAQDTVHYSARPAKGAPTTLPAGEVPGGGRHETGA